MEDIQDILIEIAINSGNAEKQLSALQRGIGMVESQLKKAKQGSKEYSDALNKQAVLQRQQQALFSRYTKELREAENIQSALNDELIRTTNEFGKESDAAKRAANAIAQQAKEVERLSKAVGTIGSVQLTSDGENGSANWKGLPRIFTELRQSLGSEIQGSILGLTGSFGQLALAIGNVGLAAGGIAAVTRAVFQLGQNAVETAAKFETMRTTLKTVFGSEGIARQIQQQLIEFAAVTPFGVEQITESYIKLANRGLKPSNEALTKLGDFAAATGKDMDQLVEAILDVNNTERWNEFGVKVQTNGNKIIGTFKGMTKEFERSEAGAMAMIEAFGAMQGIAGGMEAQSKTLSGQMSNLSDNLDQLYNQLGETFLPIAKNFVGALNEIIQAIGEVRIGVVSYGNETEVVFGNRDFQYRKIARGQAETIKLAKQEAERIEELARRYETLTNAASLNLHQKDELREIAGELIALAGEEAIQFDESGNAIRANTEVIRQAIRTRRMLADTEIASMLEIIEDTDKKVSALTARINAARSSDTDKGDELAKKLEEERTGLLQQQRAIKKELASLGIDEVEQARALLALQTQRLEKETEILKSKREALREQIAEAEETARMALLEREQAKAALIQNANLQKAVESELKQQELTIKLDGERRKLKKELEEAILNTANAEAQYAKLQERIKQLEIQRQSAQKTKNKEQLREIDLQIAAANTQSEILTTIIAQNEEIKKRNIELTGYDEKTKTFRGGVLEETMRLQQKELEMQRREALRAYQRELAEQRRKIQEMILDVEEEQNKALVEKTSERAEKEYALTLKKNELQRKAAIEAFQEETRYKGLKAEEIARGIQAINEKYRELDKQAEIRKEQELYEIKKLYAEKQQALEFERIKAQITEKQTQISFAVDADTAQKLTQEIFYLNEQLREKEYEAQKAALARELELAEGNAEAEARIKLDLQTLELKNIEARKAAELKLIDDVAKAREDALRDEFAKRAALREQFEGQSESEFLQKEAEKIGVFFGNQRKLQRERDRELRRQEIARAKERSELANEQFKEAERLYQQEVAAFGKARTETEIKFQQALANRIKAENEFVRQQNENTKKTLEERIAAFEEIISYTEQVANLTVEGIRQINAANEARREKELQIANERMNIIYKDLELGRQVNEEVIRREQERIEKIQTERKRAAETERALTLGQIVLQQILAVASAAASAAKTTQWFTIPIAVASALLAITAGARQARANVAGFRKGVIRLHGGRDENAPDTVPALLAKGESVMTVAETNRAEKILTAIRKGELEDKDLFGHGGVLYKERTISFSNTVDYKYNLKSDFDRLIHAVENIPSVRISADADGLIKYTTRRKARLEAIKKR